jgi:hypothetical protein
VWIETPDAAFILQHCTTGSMSSCMCDACDDGVHSSGESFVWWTQYVDTQLC